MPATASPGQIRVRSVAVLPALLLMATLLVVGSPAASADDLPPVISEIMYDSASAEDDWEWGELHNPGTVDIDLAGWVFDDANTAAHDAANIAAGTIPAGGSAVLFNDDDLDVADFEAAWGTGINLVGVTNWVAAAINNSGDTIALWSNFDDYGGDNQALANAMVSVAYPDASASKVGTSIHLTDLGDQSSFIESVDGASTPVGVTYASITAGGNLGGDVGSPGGTFGPPPTLSAPVISEIMYDSASGDEGDDRLTGGSSDDILDGGADTDRLNGSSGTDTRTTGRQTSPASSRRSAPKPPVVC